MFELSITEICFTIKHLKSQPHLPEVFELTHWGRVTYICVGNLTIIGSDNGLSPGRRQAIIWTYDVILLIRSLGANFSEISCEMLTFSFKKMHLKLSSVKWRPFCLGLNVLRCDYVPVVSVLFCWMPYTWSWGGGHWKSSSMRNIFARIIPFFVCGFYSIWCKISSNM